ncbi:hypothetical protein KEM56_000165 [Ascosphaera pollenicola]|nr:hypothetical protein KEM56_000165 [Ascosphaera pollenicola]
MVPKEQMPEKKDEERPNKAKKPENKRSVTFAEPLKLKPALKKTNDSYDLQEMLLLHQLAEKYEREKWLRVSSRFFDITGRRITPLDAKNNVAMEV